MNNQHDEQGRFKRKYLTEDAFTKWQSNEFHHLAKRVSHLKGQMMVVITITSGTFLIMVSLMIAKVLGG